MEVSLSLIELMQTTTVRAGSPPIWNFPDAPPPAHDVSFQYNSPVLPKRNIPQLPQMPAAPAGPSQELNFDWLEENGDALDLQDFWLQMAPGEVSVRSTMLISGSRGISISLDASI